MKKYLAGLFFVALVTVAVVPTSARAETTSSSVSGMLELLQTLMKQVEALQKQLAELKGDISEEIRDGLKEGMTNDDVKKIQELLATDPDIYPKGLASGYYGPLTKDAVKKFQKRHGLAETGIVDAETKKLMQEYLSERKDGKIPPGLLRAPGIDKKIRERMEKRDGKWELDCDDKKAAGPLCKDRDDDDDDEDEDEDEDEREDEDEDEDEDEREDDDEDNDDNDISTSTAKKAIDEAEDAISDLEEAIDDASDADAIDDAEDALDDANDELEEAEEDYDDGDFDSAYESAMKAEKIAQKAVDRLVDENDNNDLVMIDGEIKKLVSKVRIEAELWYNKNNYAYSNFCSQEVLVKSLNSILGLVDGANYVPATHGLLTYVAQNSLTGSKSNRTASCRADLSRYVVVAPLASSDKFWCIDSTGESRISGASPVGLYSCP